MNNNYINSNTAHKFNKSTPFSEQRIKFNDKVFFKFNILKH